MLDERPTIRLRSFHNGGETLYDIEGVVEVPHLNGPQRFGAGLSVSDLLPEGHKRYVIARWLREFAEALERGNPESDRQRADRLEKQLAGIHKASAAVKP